MSDDQLEHLVKWLKSIRPPGNSDIAARRAHFEAIAEGCMTPADGLPRQAIAFDGVSCEWSGSPGLAERGVILFLHGGGYSVGSARTYRGFAQRLSDVSRCRVLVPDYRLAPENPFPAGLEDALSAYASLLETGVPAEKIVISGDSAGGGLSLAVLGEIKRNGMPMPACAYLVSPWCDLTLSGASLTANAETDPIVSLASATASVARYLGESAAADDPRVSPLFADFSSYPPMLVQAGAKEALLDDSLRLADLARAAGVEVTLEVAPDMFHIFPFFYRRLTAGEKALERAGAYILEKLRSGPAGTSPATG